MMQARAQQGFTILEVLVAFLLAAMLLAVILSGFSTGLAGLSRSEKLAQAALVAESRLVGLGVIEPLTAGSSSGTAEDNLVDYRWQVNVEPFAWGYAAELGELGLEMYKVEVDVFWPATVGEHRYQLVAFRTAAGAEE